MGFGDDVLGLLSAYKNNKNSVEGEVEQLDNLAQGWGNKISSLIDAWNGGKNIQSEKETLDSLYPGLGGDILWLLKSYNKKGDIQNVVGKLNAKYFKGTYKGPAMYRLFHQFQENPIIKDEFVNHFFDTSEIDSIKKRLEFIGKEPINDDQKWNSIVYLYAILREKNGDDIISSAIANGCRQILNLGTGYCTRFFRLPVIKEKNVHVIEVDLPEVIENKTYDVRKITGQIPDNLSLVPLDFNRDDLNKLSNYGFNNQHPTVYLWEGVSYYLPVENVSNMLDFIHKNMVTGSAFVFDCCTPLLLYKNDMIPGVNSNIEFLKRMGSPYLFGMNIDEMENWLISKGFENPEILNQDDLEYRYFQNRTIPNNMFYAINYLS